MQKIIYFFVLIFSGMGLFLFFTSNNNLSLSDIPKTASQEDVAAEKKIPEQEKPIDPKADIEPQKKLENTRILHSLRKVL